MFGIPYATITAFASTGIFGVILTSFLVLWPAMRKLSLTETEIALRIHQAANDLHQRDMSDCKQECEKLRALVRDLDEVVDKERRERRLGEDKFREEILALKLELAGYHREKIQSAASALAVIPRKLAETLKE